MDRDGRKRFVRLEQPFSFGPGCKPSEARCPDCGPLDTTTGMTIDMMTKCIILEEAKVIALEVQDHQQTPGIVVLRLIPTFPAAVLQSDDVVVLQIVIGGVLEVPWHEEEMTHILQEPARHLRDGTLPDVTREQDLLSAVVHGHPTVATEAHNL